MTIEIDSIYCRDCLDLMREIPDGSIDAVITDPPYSSGGMYRGDRARPTGSKYLTEDHGYPDFPGDGRDQRSFSHWCAMWLSQCWRAAKNGAIVAVFTDWRQLPTITDAVQDGMPPADVRPYLDRFDGIFIGGTVAWKWRTAPDWIIFAHAAGIPVHIGQVGTVRNYLRAYALGADSVDGSSPMRHKDLGRVERFRATLREQRPIDHRWENLAAGITGEGRP